MRMATSITSAVRAILTIDETQPDRARSDTLHGLADPPNPVASSSSARVRDSAQETHQGGRRPWKYSG